MTKKYRLTEGRSNGVRCIDIDMGDLAFTIISDRCMDIGEVKLRGQQVAFLSKNGIVSPAYYNPRDYGWLESFGGGLVATCGLQNVGDPCEYNGQHHGLHGRIGNIPAENISIEVERDADMYTAQPARVTVTGTVRERAVLGCCYELCRTITAQAAEAPNKSSNPQPRDTQYIITLNDQITNLSDIPQPLMLLYHINFGYPMINPGATLTIPGSQSIEPFDKHAEANLKQWMCFTPPSAGAPEEVFLHKFAPSPDGMGWFSICSGGHKPMTVNVSYSQDSLPYLGLWKNFRPQEYAMGLEPCNNHIRGVALEDANGSLQTLQPNEKTESTIRFHLE